MFFNLLRIFVEWRQMFYWFKMFTEWRQIKIVEPRPLKKDIMKKNESIDNFIKIQIPWIL